MTHEGYASSGEFIYIEIVWSLQDAESRTASDKFSELITTILEVKEKFELKFGLGD